jgi:SAM-dependent methyltransferase
MPTLTFRAFTLLIPLLMVVASPSEAQRASPQPYRCGFVLESEASIRKAYGPELKALGLKAGQVVADVGGSNGYRMAMFAVCQDSLTFYIEDIDTACLNARELEAVKQYYSTVNGGPLRSEFHLVVGTETETMLPDGTFDKVLLTASYHHFSDPAAMLLDIRRKLKRDGRIYLVENVVRQTGQHRRRLCDDPLKSESDLREELERQGFTVEAVHELGRWWTKMFVLTARD